MVDLGVESIGAVGSREIDFGGVVLADGAVLDGK